MLSIVFGICVFFAVTGLALAFIFVTNLPFLYDIGKLGLVEATGYPKEEIIANYKAVISFLNPFSRAEFSLPTMKFSASGASHFADCKPIFNTFFILAIAGAIVCYMLIASKKRINYKAAAISMITIPFLVLSATEINFEGAFELFHRIFFRNLDWQFDPAVDEIINILPEEFFLHCVFVIGMFWVITMAYLVFKNTSNKRR